MIKWIRNNWKDPVWSKVFASIIIAIPTLIWILIQTIVEQISIQESLYKFWSLIDTKVYFPLWLIILLIISIAFFLLKKIIKRKNISIYKKENKDRETNSDNLLFECPHSYEAKDGFNSSINTQMLQSESGIFNIWGYVNDEHNRIYPKKRFLYLIGFATNNGISLKNPSFAIYPNAWAISRITPTDSDNFGLWRFWCNNISKDVTHLDFKKVLTGGWHLFTVSWSKSDDYIKFIIDCELVAEDKFKNWPTDFSGSLMVGTWTNKASIHYFNSKVGPWKFTGEKYNRQLIQNYFNVKPK